MRVDISRPFLLIAGIVVLSSNVSTGQESEHSRLKANPYSTVAQSYVQVSMNLINEGDEPMWIPVCAEQSTCEAFTYLEQWDDLAKSWRKTIEMSMGHLTWRSIAKLEAGEGIHLSFRFHPNYWSFPNGSKLKYPGKVRLVLLAWEMEKFVGDRSWAIQIVTKPIDIPAPPEGW